MKTIRQMRILKLKWIKPSAYRREYQLISNEGELGGGAGVNHVLAIIRWDKTYSSLATAESADGKWTFKRQGFFHPSVAIRLADRKEDKDDDVAILHIIWDGSGVLEFRGSDNGGSKYWWKRVNYWRTEYTFAKRNEDNNDDGHILLHFKPEFKFARLEGTVDISQDALLLQEISLLVILGWYMLVLVGDDRKPF